MKLDIDLYVSGSGEGSGEGSLEITEIEELTNGSFVGEPES